MDFSLLFKALFGRFSGFVSGRPIISQAPATFLSKEIWIVEVSPCIVLTRVARMKSYSQHSGWVNVSYTRLLMRPETKERADTIIGSVLRGSFTFYQATAGDMRGERGRDMEIERK